MRSDPGEIWMKAAVTGGLWASFEIIVGSMLHNLHLPFSGTILATFSVILMVAFLQVWKVRGLIWRAGLICGLMKSLSPSAVILGPMTGIMMEAFIVELIILLAGRNLLAYLLAGAGALLSAILHKLINLFILYGRDLVTIYSNLFIFLKKSLNLHEASARDIIIGILLVYVGLGMLAALAGYVAGKRASQLAPPELGGLRIDPFKEAWDKVDQGTSFRVTLLLLHIVMIPLNLLLINHYGLGWQALLPAGAYLLFLLLYYPRIKWRLLKPFFWVQLLIMTMVAGFFWNPENEAFLNGGMGFLVGLEMCLRAIMIVSAFSALSVEIRNPRITKKLMGGGMGNLYAALSLAFNSLPVMLDRSSGLRTFLRNPLRSFVRMIAEAESWLRCYQTELKN